MSLTSTQPFGDINILVEYEYDPGEPAEGPESRAAGPGSPASVTIIGVNIIGVSGHGCMVDADEFSESRLAFWREQILQEHME